MLSNSTESTEIIEQVLTDSLADKLFNVFTFERNESNCVEFSDLLSKALYINADQVEKVVKTTLAKSGEHHTSKSDGRSQVSWRFFCSIRAVWFEERLVSWNIIQELFRIDSDEGHSYHEAVMVFINKLINRYGCCKCCYRHDSNVLLC